MPTTAKPESDFNYQQSLRRSDTRPSPYRTEPKLESTEFFAAIFLRSIAVLGLVGLGFWLGMGWVQA